MAITVLGLAAVASAQAACPEGAICYFGTDTDGSSTTPATNVESAAARASFLSGLTGAGTESFETFPAGTPAPLALAFAGAGTATLSGGGAVRSGQGDSVYPTSGSRFYQAETAGPATSIFTIDFSAPVSAFGFYGVDLGDFGAQLSLIFTLVGGGTQTWTLPYTALPSPGYALDGSLLYAGFVNPTSFTSVAFRGSRGGDAFGIDELSIGSTVTTPVPEPETWALFAAGLGALGLARRRRRTA